MRLTDLRKEYTDLSNAYTELVSGSSTTCPKCGAAIKTDSRYLYKCDDYKNGFFPICKECLQKIAEPPGSEAMTPIARRRNIKEVLHFMNYPYIGNLYMECINDVGSTSMDFVPVFSEYMERLTTKSAYKGLVWANSTADVDDDSYDTTEFGPVISRGKKRFGGGFLDEDYIFLETEYEDLVSRCECQTKAQESIYERLAMKKWEIMKATRNGEKTDSLDKSYMDLLSSANILPRQTKGSEMDNSEVTLGTFAEEWERHDPIPDTAFKDIDGIGKYIRVWFTGVLCHIFKFKNPYEQEYEDYIKEYSVSRDDESETDADGGIYDTIFGKSEDS